MGRLLNNFLYDLTHDPENGDKKSKVEMDKCVFSSVIEGPVKIYRNKYGDFSIDLINEETGNGYSFQYYMADTHYNFIFDIRMEDMGEVIAEETLTIRILVDDSRFGVGSMSINLINSEGYHYTIVTTSADRRNVLQRHNIRKFEKNDNSEDDYLFGYFPDVYDYTGHETPKIEDYQ